MIDIVDRLRDKHCCDDTCHCDEAAAEIERLRAALEPFANAVEGNWSQQPDSLPIVAGYGAHDLRLRFTLGDFRRARAALEAPQGRIDTAQPAAQGDAND